MPPGLDFGDESYGDPYGSAPDGSEEPNSPTLIGVDPSFFEGMSTPERR
jgi:hypothetical protein